MALQRESDNIWESMSNAEKKREEKFKKQMNLQGGQQNK